MSVVLMYHALYRGNDTSAIDEEDLPYAVSESAFISQLDRMVGREVGVFAPGCSPQIVITFDDGHQSNLDIAVPLLLERGMGAYFFITTDFIGKRTGFMTAAEVRQLSETPDMITGSHGVSHEFFDDMSDSAAKQELLDSRIQVEGMTGKACLSMSFPGGRYNKKTLQLLQEAGYQQWFGSDVGIVSQSESLVDPSEGIDVQSGENLSKMSILRPLERVAVRSTTQLDEFDRMIAPNATYYISHRRRALAKKLLRQVIGNRLYHGLYKSLSSR